MPIAHSALTRPPSNEAATAVEHAGPRENPYPVARSRRQIERKEILATASRPETAEQHVR